MIETLVSESEWVQRQQLDRRLQARGGADRRTEPRLLVDELATLHLLRPSVEDAITVQVVDMSQSGLGLHSAEPLPVGSMVHVRIRNTIVAMGQVRYSTKVKDGYYSGVRVEHTADCRTSWESD